MWQLTFLGIFYLTVLATVYGKKSTVNDVKDTEDVDTLFQELVQELNLQGRDKPRNHVGDLKSKNGADVINFDDGTQDMKKKGLSELLKEYLLNREIKLHDSKPVSSGPMSKKGDAVCYADEFKCVGDNYCISTDWLCDGFQDCRDGSDEEHCKDHSCADGYFTCTNGECTYDFWRCDGFSDCLDGSDEVNCNSGEGWSEWTDWGQCNVNCGTGEHSRSRHCLNADGTGCNGEYVQYSLCHLKPCYQEAASGCGTRNMPAQPRVVGGEDALPGEWPWQAQLFYKPYNDVVCGGTLIGPKHVLSAAHCFHPDGSWNNENNWIVRLGKFRRDSDTGYGDEPLELKIRHIYRHEHYNVPTSNDNDIALLELDHEVDPTDFINSACLDTTQNMNFDEHSYCFVTGWGTTHGDTNKYPEVLQEAMVPLLSLHDCNATSAYNGMLTSNMLCAGHFGGGIDACQGDSGGPLVCMHRNADDGLGHWYLVGVVSFGFGCAEENAPGVYANVENYLDWIKYNGGMA